MRTSTYRLKVVELPRPKNGIKWIAIRDVGNLVEMCYALIPIDDDEYDELLNHEYDCDFSERKPLHQFTEGQKVYHRHRGPGTIIELVGRNALRVQFDEEDHEAFICADDNLKPVKEA